VALNAQHEDRLAGGREALKRRMALLKHLAEKSWIRLGKLVGLQEAMRLLQSHEKSWNHEEIL